MDWREAKLGADVLPGWEPIVDRLHQKVLELDPNVVVDQVKEKFGGLRYYYSSEVEFGSWPTPIDDLVTEAEKEAAKTCEVCGADAPDGATGKYWLKTLCPEHQEIRETTGQPAWKMVEK